MDAAAYYVGYNIDEQPALFRIDLTQGTATAAATVVELVDGVENMQVLYGEDTDSDRVADRYISANQVTTWANIVSIRASLLMRSTESAADELDTKTYTLGENVTIDPQDSRDLRYVASSTVKLRNRALPSNITMCEAGIANSCKLKDGVVSP